MTYFEYVTINETEHARYNGLWVATPPRSPGRANTPGFLGVKLRDKTMSENKRQSYKCPHCLQQRFFDDDCKNCTPAQKKAKSDHRELLEFFHDMTLKCRGFKPRISPKDAKQLKNILDLGVLDKDEIEKLILYFLADPSYRNLGPSMATMFSSTVVNSLINKLKNRHQFYKELDNHASRYLPSILDPGRRKVIVSGQEVDIGAKVDELRKKLSIKREINNERE